MARRWKVLIVTSVAVFMALLDVTIVNIAFPDMRDSFPGASLGGLSWVLNAYNVVFAAALVPAGRLADRLGRRKVFLSGLIIFVLASLACGAAPNVEFLVVARIVQAVGAAAIVPISLSLVLPEFPVEQRATAIALSTASGAIAAATGPTLGGLLVDWQGWRWVFFVNLVIGLAAFIPARRLLKESERDGETRWPDLFGTALFTAGIVALALSLVKAEDWGWGSAQVIGGLGAAVVLLAAFVVRSARHHTPVFELGLFRVRSFSMSNTGAFSFAAGFYALLLCNVLLLTGAWHYGVFTAALGVTPGAVMATVGAAFAGRLVQRYGARVIAVLGGVLFGAGALLLAVRVGAEPDYLGVFLPSAVLTGLGVGLAFASFSSAVVSRLPGNRYATGIAISQCFRQIGAVVGIAALVAVLDAGGGYQAAYILIGTAGLVSAVAGLMVGTTTSEAPRSPIRTPEPSTDAPATR